MSTYTDPLFDELDLAEDRNYCEHGTFIGNPYGGDYLCGPCESGISGEDYRTGQLLAANRHRRQATAQAFLAEAFGEIHAELASAPEPFKALAIAIVTSLWSTAR